MMKKIAILIFLISGFSALFGAEKVKVEVHALLAKNSDDELVLTLEYLVNDKLECKPVIPLEDYEPQLYLCDYSTRLFNKSGLLSQKDLVDKYGFAVEDVDAEARSKVVNESLKSMDFKTLSEEKKNCILIWSEVQETGDPTKYDLHLKFSDVHDSAKHVIEKFKKRVVLNEKVKLWTGKVIPQKAP